MALVPGSMGMRHFVPLAFVLCTIFGALLAFGAGSMLFAGLFALMWGAYLLLDGFYAYTIAQEKGARYFPVELILFPAFHFAYGIGSLKGILALPGFLGKHREKSGAGT